MCMVGFGSLFGVRCCGHTELLTTLYFFDTNENSGVFESIRCLTDLLPLFVPVFVVLLPNIRLRSEQMTSC